MTSPITRSAPSFVLITSLFVLLFCRQSAAQAPDSISVQGLLKNSAGIILLDGNYELQFKLYHDGSPVWTETHPSVPVSGGVFNVLLGQMTALDTVAFDSPFELGIKVGSDPEIAPRTPLASAAYAKALPGMYTFVGKAAFGSAYNVVGGGPNNEVGSNVIGATVSGGGGHVSGMDGPNRALGSHSTVGGGFLNTAVGNSSTVGGGSSNEALGNFATVAGGGSNMAIGDLSTVAGGLSNEAAAEQATVGGGSSNRSIGFYSTVPGGIQNVARGTSSFAAGAWARANHDGSFVWNSNDPLDVQLDSLSTTANGQFLVKAFGGVGIGGPPSHDLTVRDTNEDGLAEFAVTPDGGVHQVLVSADAGGGWIGSETDLTIASDQGRISIGASGRIGINIADPGAVELGIWDLENDDDSWLRWQTATPTVEMLAGIHPGNAGMLSVQTFHPLIFRTNQSERLRITEGGLIGIGTSNPAARLHVLRSSSTSIPQLRVESSNTTSTDFARIRMTNSNTSNYWDIAAGGTLNTEFNFFNATRGNIISLRSTGTPLITYNGAQLTAGGTWMSASSADRKTDFRPLNPEHILERLASIPVREWRYKVEPKEVRHIGPTSQEFYQAFGLGDNHEGIAMVDADGIALAAIQGLYRLVKEQRAEIERMRAAMQRAGIE